MEFNLNKVAVIGSGVMGSGIAAQIASSGIETILFDIVPFSLTEEQEKKGLTLEDKEVRYSIVQKGYNAIVDKKHGPIYDKKFTGLLSVANLSDDLELLKSCDWIIEVVVENLDIKHQTYAKIAPYISDTAIITTNTSGISISKIAEGLPKHHQERFFGSHFFNPVRYMHLLEIIETETTNHTYVEFIEEVVKSRLGKGVVYAKDTPNFIANRIGVFAQCSILRTMNDYDFNFSEIDSITGPLIGRPKSASFRTLDLVGLDILKHTANTSLNNLDGEKEDLSVFQLPDYYLKMLDNKQLGNKTRQGFYKRERGPKGNAFKIWDPSLDQYVEIDKTILPEVLEAKKAGNFEQQINTLVFGDAPANKFALKHMSEVLIYCANCVGEITDDFHAIDNAMEWGYNWSMGPFKLWDILGFDKVIEHLNASGYTIPKWILEKEDKFFYNKEELSTSLSSEYDIIDDIPNLVSALDLGDGVVCIEFQSPGHSANIELLKFVQKIICMVEQTPKYKGIVIGNKVGNFCAGVDIKEVIKLAKSGGQTTIDGVITNFQATSRAIKYSKKPIVSAVQGMALGGGVEIAIHSHKVVAHVESYMGFIEAGVGIIPAAHGCVEMVQRGMRTIENYNFADATPIITSIWENIAMAKVSKDAYEAQRMGYLAQTDRIIMNKDQLIDTAKEEVLTMSKNGFIQRSPEQIKVLGTDGYGTIAYMVQAMYEGNFISEHDKLVALKLARTLTGGDVPIGTMVSEKHMMELERESGSSLILTEKSQARMQHMAEKKKPLRN